MTSWGLDYTYRHVMSWSKIQDAPFLHTHLEVQIVAENIETFTDPKLSMLVREAVETFQKLNLTMPASFGISPSIQERRLDFPEPTVPQTATRVPVFTFRFILVRVGSSMITGSQLNSPCSISIATPALWFLGM